MNRNLNLMAIFALLGLLLLILYIIGGEPGKPPGISFKEVPRFESYSALLNAFKEGQQARGYGITETAIMPLATGVAKDTVAAGEAAVSYSRTNIQVEGVDEADIVKSDGKYIYNFSSNRLVITDAYPIESAQIVYKTELENLTPIEMFVAGNELLLFGNRYVNYGYETGVVDTGVVAPESVRCIDCWWGGGTTVVQLYDISNRASPTIEKEFEFQGNYLSSRLIGRNAYFVINSWPDYRILEEGNGNIIPLMKEDGVEKRIAEATEIGFLPPMPAQNFVTIVSINLETEETKKETIVGNAQNVFASLDNLYITAGVWLPPIDIPVVREATEPILGDVEKTAINKFALLDGEIKFVGQGIVPGHILNQFSMDEFESNFRIATTVGWAWGTGEQQSKNNLYVFDKEMNLVGKLEDLAPGEEIYSARFMGKKAYMVTFKKIDPLFVIDVSDPTQPKVLGKLKIPGYSDYLHPIDETHIIGVGKEAIESKYGDFAWYQGMKMAIFDVSDVANPIEMHKVVIGDRGTDSYALHDHKAFLYDREKELLILPIMLAEIPEEQKKPLPEGQEWPAYGEPVFQGAFVFRLTLQNGFEERGRITHVSAEDELKRGYYFGDEYSVKRALYIDNVLYTLSERMLKANDLGTLQELKEFEFE